MLNPLAASCLSCQAQHLKQSVWFASDLLVRRSPALNPPSLHSCLAANVMTDRAGGTVQLLQSQRYVSYNSHKLVITLQGACLLTGNVRALQGVSEARCQGSMAGTPEQRPVQPHCCSVVASPHTPAPLVGR